MVISLDAYERNRMRPNPAVDLAPFGRWTLRDEAAQRGWPGTLDGWVNHGETSNVPSHWNDQCTDIHRAIRGRFDRTTPLASEHIDLYFTPINSWHLWSANDGLVYSPRYPH